MKDLYNPRTCLQEMEETLLVQHGMQQQEMQSEHGLYLFADQIDAALFLIMMVGMSMFNARAKDNKVPPTSRIIDANSALLRLSQKDTRTIQAKHADVQVYLTLRVLL